MSEATSGIASLIARIKQDGVQAGEQERLALLEAAHRQAADIVASARKEAEAVRQDAQSEASRLRTQLDAELRMAARDFVFRFQERLCAQVIAPLTQAAATAAATDADAMAGLVMQLLAGNTGGASIRTDPALRDRLVAALAAQVNALVDGPGVEIVDEAGLGGFRLTRKGEHFVWDVSQQAIARELSRLVEPSLRSALSLQADPT